VLPAVRQAAPDLRHAVCGYVQRRGRGLLRDGVQQVTVPAMCGRDIDLPLPLDSPDPRDKCMVCLDLARQHGQHCDCWKLWPDSSRIPR
jgi:hypothetical protein